MDSPIRIIVPVSGGKDSQACLKLALENYPASQVRGLFCDTLNEHPLTYAHIDKMRELYGVRIDRVNNGSVEWQCYKHERLPSGTARFCTEELKIWPAKWYYRALAEEQGGFEVWYGMREGESRDRAERYAAMVNDELYEPHEVLKKYPQYLGAMGVRFRLAVLDWSEDEVKRFVGLENLNPLYLERDGEPGFDRVGCFPCEASGDAPRAKAYQFDDFGRQQYRKFIRIAADLGKPFFNSKHGEAKHGGACALHCGI
jgi:3'-phosphoadenosine 5'-phosphosulfate sulfotransferase (PAPS reductase)/FAD synthetase